MNFTVWGTSAADQTAEKAPRPFALRLAGFILSGTALIFLAALGYNYYASRAQTMISGRARLASPGSPPVTSNQV